MLKLQVISNKKQAVDLTHMSSLKGKLYGITYRDMVNTFGEPTYGPEDSGDGKVNFEWVFKYNNEVFTVYDWKVSQEYTKYILGRPNELQFHVGGHTNCDNFVKYLERKVAKSIYSRAYDNLRSELNSMGIDFSTEN